MEQGDASTPWLEIARLRHFLYFGLEGNCYNTGKHIFVLNNINCLNSLISTREGGFLVLQTAFQFAKGPHVSTEAILFAIAACARSTDPIVKQKAFETLYDLSLTAPQLFAYIRFSEEISRPASGWGRAQRKFVSEWYNQKNCKKLAEEVTQITSRHRWKHRDLLRLAHVKTENHGTAVVLGYLTKGIEVAVTEAERHSITQTNEIIDFLKAVNEVKHTSDEHVVSRLVEMHDLAIEHIPTPLLKSKEVWTCLVPRIPIRTLLKQLPKLHRITLIKPNSAVTKLIIERISQEISQSIHKLGPLEIFVIMKHCEDTIRLTSPVKSIHNPPRHRKSPIDDALLSLYFDSFKNLSSTGKRFLVAVDVRNTMVHNKISGYANLNPADATAVLLMALSRAETAGVTAIAFSMRGMAPIDINNKMNLYDISKRMRETPMGPVNFAAPVQWALEKRKAFDVILVCTDNQTQISDVHPTEALKEYRSSMNLPQAKMILCAMASPGFAITPPEEFGMLDIAGFDTNVMQVIQDFARGVF